jgi:outer membrane protein assembly factor BamA
VRDALAFEPGEVWDGRLLQKSQQRLFALGTFSLVDVSPSRDVEPGEQREVPVTVAITESRFQTVRAGVGANYDGILLEPRLSTSYRHVHLLDRLLQAELTGQIGYSIGSGNLGPERGSRTTGSLALSMSTPRLAGPHTGLAVSAALSRDIFGGQYLKLDQTADARFTWRPDPDVTVDVGPGVERTRIGDGGQRLLREVFGRDFDGTYVLAAFGAGLTIDWRDDPLATTRGSWFQVGVRQTLPLGTRPYVFSELSGDARTFPAHPPPKGRNSLHVRRAAHRAHAGAVGGARRYRTRSGRSSVDRRTSGRFACSRSGRTTPCAPTAGRTRSRTCRARVRT